MSRRFLPLLSLATALLLVGGGLLLAFGGRIGAAVAARFGPQVLKAGGGKFSDPAEFITLCLGDGLRIAAAALLIVWLLYALDRLGARFDLYRTARGVWLGLLGFAGVNLFLAACFPTVVFWVPFFDKRHVDNFAQYQLKRGLVRMQHAPRHVVLIGSSQTQASIDEVILNRRLAPEIWTTEMHQPGSMAADCLLIARDLQEVRADLFVCYLSPSYFYGQPHGEVVGQFLRWRDLADLQRLGASGIYPGNSVPTGLTGDVLPLFRARLSLAQRILGGPLTKLAQMQFDQALETDLAAQARRRKDAFQLGPKSAYQQRALRQLAADLQARGQRLVLIRGHLLPTLESMLDPALIADLEQFLAQLGRDFPNVRVLQQAELMPPLDRHFGDLVHFNDAAQDEFSEALARWLKSDFEAAKR